MNLDKRPDQPIANPYAPGQAVVQPNYNHGLVVNDKPWSPRGRFGRLSLLAWNMLLGLGVFALALIIFMVMGGTALLTAAIDGGLASMGLSLILFGGLYLAFLVMSVIFSIRRLHDLDKSGWLCLLSFIPLINVLYSLYIYLAPGTPGPNRFGPRRPTAGWEKVVGWIAIVLTTLNLVALLFIAVPAYQQYTQRVQESSKLDQMMQDRIQRESAVDEATRTMS